MDEESKKKGGKGLLAVTCLLAVATIGLGVGLVIAMSKKCDEKECAKVAEDKAAVAMTENDEKIRNLIKDAEAAHAAALDNYSADRLFDYGVQISVGDGVIMPTAHSYGLQNTSTSDTYYSLVSSRRAALNNKIVEIFNKYGLKKASEPKGYFSWGAENYAFYENDNIVCYYSTEYGFSLECADKRWISEEDKALVLALAGAYEKKEGKKVGYLDARKSAITKNSAGTYERIVASFDDAAALFYRKVGGEWKFFMGVQQGPSCEEYSTSELKEAYAGEKCWDNKGNENTVK